MHRAVQTHWVGSVSLLAIKSDSEQTVFALMPCHGSAMH